MVELFRQRSRRMLRRALNSWSIAHHFAGAQSAQIAAAVHRFAAVCRHWGALRLSRGWRCWTSLIQDQQTETREVRSAAQLLRRGLLRWRERSLSRAWSQWTSTVRWGAQRRLQEKLYEAQRRRGAKVCGALMRSRSQRQTARAWRRWREQTFGGAQRDRLVMRETLSSLLYRIGAWRRQSVLLAFRRWSYSTLSAAAQKRQDESRLLACWSLLQMLESFATPAVAAACAAT